MKKRIIYALGVLFVSNAHAQSLAQLEEFTSHFVVDIAHYFAGTEHAFLSGDVQKELSSTIAKSFDTQIQPLTCRSEATFAASTVVDSANNMQLEVSVHLLPNHSADELTQALEELSAEIDEWHEVAEQLFVLDEARATLAGAIASKPSQSLEEAVDAMLPIIRAEAGTSMSPYTISGVRVDRIVDANAQGAKRYEVEVNCQKPSMYDKSLYVRSMMEAIERAYGRVVDVERRDGVAPVGLEAAITLLHRANGTLRYSQPAAKHVASLTHLVAKSFDRTNVAYVAQDMHHALCAEFATFMQQEVIAKATSVEHMAAFQAAMGDYSTRTIAQAGMPEGMFLFNDEDIAAFEGDLEKLCSYVEIEIQAFESGDIERLWQEAQN